MTSMRLWVQRRRKDHSPDPVRAVDIEVFVVYTPACHKYLEPLTATVFTRPHVTSPVRYLKSEYCAIDECAGLRRRTCAMDGQPDGRHEQCMSLSK